jgi:carbon starvation protein CstA
MHSIRDHFIYLGIALSVLAIVIAYAEFSSPNATFPLPMITFVAMTALLCGYLVREYKGKLRSWRHWVVLIVLLSGHCVIWVAVFRYFNKTPLLLMGILVGPEYWLFSSIIDRLPRHSGFGSRLRRQIEISTRPR